MVAPFVLCARQGASRRFHEPPDAEPQVRWCGRTAGVIPPPTRFGLGGGKGTCGVETLDGVLCRPYGTRSFGATGRGTNLLANIGPPPRLMWGSKREFPARPRPMLRSKGSFDSFGVRLTRSR